MVLGRISNSNRNNKEATPGSSVVYTKHIVDASLTKTTGSLCLTSSVKATDENADSCDDFIPAQKRAYIRQIKQVDNKACNAPNLLMATLGNEMPSQLIDNSTQTEELANCDLAKDALAVNSVCLEENSQIIFRNSLKLSLVKDASENLMSCDDKRLKKLKSNKNRKKKSRKILNASKMQLNDCDNQTITNNDYHDSSIKTLTETKPLTMSAINTNENMKNNNLSITNKNRCYNHEILQKSLQYHSLSRKTYYDDTKNDSLSVTNCNNEKMLEETRVERDELSNRVQTVKNSKNFIKIKSSKNSKLKSISKEVQKNSDNLVITEKSSENNCENEQISDASTQKSKINHKIKLSENVNTEHESLQNAGANRAHSEAKECKEISKVSKADLAKNSLSSLGNDVQNHGLVITRKHSLEKCNLKENDSDLSAGGSETQIPSVNFEQSNVVISKNSNDILCHESCLCTQEIQVADSLSNLTNGFNIDSLHNFVDGNCVQIDNENGNDDDNEDDDLPNYSGNYVYEERIIDYENLRIIEHVIDSNYQEKGKESKKESVTKLKTAKSMNNHFNYENENKAKAEKENNLLGRKIIVVGAGVENQNNSKLESILRNDDNNNNNNNNNNNKPQSSILYKNPSLNFSCSDLVAFIGESYKFIDNPQLFYDKDNADVHTIKNSTNCDKTPIETRPLTSSPFKRTKRSLNANNQFGGHRSVDDNNNTRRFSGLTPAERLLQSLNCDNVRDRRLIKQEKAKLSPTLIALKSKLTPLAPPFQPAAVKAKLSAAIAATSTDNAVAVVTSNTCTSSSSTSLTNNALYSVEQTMVYYRQQHHHSQQQKKYSPSQQQQLPVQPQNCHTLSTVTSVAQQQQQVSPSQTTQQQKLFLTPHQQHCAQHILAMSQGIPHIHIQSAITNCNNGNNSDMTTNQPHTHFVPVQLIPTAGGLPSWQPVDAPPIYMDANGELRTFCPAHGPPATAVAVGHMTPVTSQTPACVATTLLQQASNHAPINSNYVTSNVHYHHPAQLHHQQSSLAANLGTDTNGSGIALTASNSANSSFSSLRMKTPQTLALASSGNNCLMNTTNYCPTSPTVGNATSSVTAATATPSSLSNLSNSGASRVLVQLDAAATAAGISLPLQLAGKRKLFRAEELLLTNLFYIYFDETTSVQ
ncbi:hypothetical protein GQX74_002007 [Glossina fuscipes]|nr:hypothetical protein GQX74_002007 [Glossina fuscipes]